MKETHSKKGTFLKENLLGVGITVASEREVLEYIVTGLGEAAEKYYVVTPNPELLVIANNDPEYKKVLNCAKLASPDGVGVILAGKILGKGFKGKITGVDLVEKLCGEVVEQPITVGFLGGGPGVAIMARDCLQKKYPGLKIALAESGNPDDKTVDLIQEKTLKTKGVDILFVAFGSPKQEFWIYKNLEKLPVKVAIGVGGAFDFISGNVKRAPGWVQKIGLEWFFRLINQPWRFKRQLALITFIKLVLKEKLAGSK